MRAWTLALVVMFAPASAEAQFSRDLPEGSDEGCYVILNGAGLLPVETYPMRIELRREGFDYGWHAVGLNQGFATLGRGVRRVLAPWQPRKDTLHVELDWTYPLRPVRWAVKLLVGPKGVVTQATIHETRLSLREGFASSDRWEDYIKIDEAHENVAVVKCGMVTPG